MTDADSHSEPLPTHEGWCPWCHELALHSRLEHSRGRLRRSKFRCSKCGGRSSPCRVPNCPNLARGVRAPHEDAGVLQRLRDAHTNWLCPEHDGSVRDFEALARPIDYLDDWTDVLRPKAKRGNIYRRTAQVAGAAATAAVLIYMPHLGRGVASALGRAGLLGSTAAGTTISGLSGAALTNASLAALGGGSLAAGGAGMAGGVVVVSAAGSALGGHLGGSIASQLVGSIGGFDIQKVREGKSPAVVVSSGFLTERTGIEPWIPMLDRQWSGHRVYQVKWRSKQPLDLFLSKGLLTPGGPTKVAALATKGLRLWSEAVTNSSLAGAVLADLLCRTQLEDRFILVGHSLGARLMSYALEALGTRSGPPRVESAWLLGAAIERDSTQWSTRVSATESGIINAYSSRDAVLEVAYPLGSMFTSRPLGLGAVPTPIVGIRDVDLTDCVGRDHSAYIKCLGAVLPTV